MRKHLNTKFAALLSVIGLAIVAYFGARAIFGFIDAFETHPDVSLGSTNQFLWVAIGMFLFIAGDSFLYRVPNGRLILIGRGIQLIGSGLSAAVNYLGLESQWKFTSPDQTVTDQWMVEYSNLGLPLQLALAFVCIGQFLIASHVLKTPMNSNPVARADWLKFGRFVFYLLVIALFTFTMMFESYLLDVVQNQEELELEKYAYNFSGMLTYTCAANILMFLFFASDLGSRAVQRKHPTK